MVEIYTVCPNCRNDIIIDTESIEKTCTCGTTVSLIPIYDLITAARDAIGRGDLEDAAKWTAEAREMDPRSSDVAFLTLKLMPSDPSFTVTDLLKNLDDIKKITEERGAFYDWSISNANVGNVIDSTVKINIDMCDYTKENLSRINTQLDVYLGDVVESSFEYWRPIESRKVKEFFEFICSIDNETSQKSWNALCRTGPMMIESLVICHVYVECLSDYRVTMVCLGRLLNMKWGFLSKAKIDKNVLKGLRSIHSEISDYIEGLVPVRRSF